VARKTFKGDNCKLSALIDKVLLMYTHNLMLLILDTLSSIICMCVYSVC